MTDDEIEDLWERAGEYYHSHQQALLPLQTERCYTGRTADGRQLLALFNESDVTLCWFNAEGKHEHSNNLPHPLKYSTGNASDEDRLDFLRCSIEYDPGDIHIYPFEERQLGVAIKPMPYWLVRFILDPYDLDEERRTSTATAVQRWMDNDEEYVLEAWGNTFFIDSRTGECTAS